MSFFPVLLVIQIWLLHFIKVFSSFSPSRIPFLLVLPLLFAVLVVFGVHFFCSYLFHSKIKCFILTNIISLVLFTYGAIYDALKLRHSLLCVLLFILVMAAWRLLSKLEEKKLGYLSGTIKNVLFLTTGFLVIQFFSVFFLSHYYAKQLALADHSNFGNLSLPKDDRPDVYHIIFDSYTSAEKLQKVFNFENQETEEFLKTNHFEVIKNTKSNYNTSLFSSSSFLNSDYHDSFFDFKKLNELSKYYKNKTFLFHPYNDIITQAVHIILKEKITNNDILKFFKNNGYQTRQLLFFDPNPYLSIPIYNDFSLNLSSVEYLCLRTSFFRMLSSSILQKFRPESHLLKKKNLLQRHNLNVPVYNYVHFLIPHNFYFDRYGNKSKTGFSSDFNTYLSQYKEEMYFVNQELKSIVTQILASSKKTPIIIIQSDHGPHWCNQPDRCLDLHTSVFNAILLPSSKKLEDQKMFTLVNTYRLLFRDYFKLPVPILDNHLFDVNFSDKEPIQGIDTTKFNSNF